MSLGCVTHDDPACPPAGHSLRPLSPCWCYSAQIGVIWGQGCHVNFRSSSNSGRIRAPSPELTHSLLTSGSLDLFRLSVSLRLLLFFFTSDCISFNLLPHFVMCWMSECSQLDFTSLVRRLLKIKLHVFFLIPFFLTVLIVNEIHHPFCNIPETFSSSWSLTQNSASHYNYMPTVPGLTKQLIFVQNLPKGGIHCLQQTCCWPLHTQLRSFQCWKGFLADGWRNNSRISHLN